MDIKELKDNSDKNGGFDKYLYDSFVNALYTNPRISPKEQYPNVVESDFPLNNLAEYFDGYVNGDDYFFWRRIFMKNLNEQGPIHEPINRIYSSFISDFEQLFNIKKSEDNLNNTLMLSHGTKESREVLGGHLSSTKSLKLIKLGGTNTFDYDERLKNTGFVFTILCSENNNSVGQYIRPSKTKIFFKNIKKFPIAVVSLDQKDAGDYDDNDWKSDVYLCSGKNLDSILLRSHSLDLNDFNEDKKNKYNNFGVWYEKYGTNYPYECRIPTYLIPSDEDFYK